MFEEAARKYALLVLVLALLFVVCLSENGIVEYFKLKSRIGAADVSIRELQAENVALKGKLDRIKHDDRYLEDMARKRLGFIREGEKVYRFEK